MTDTLELLRSDTNAITKTQNRFDKNIELSEIE